MSSLGSNSGNMGAPSFHEFKKQASFFFKEKIKTARLALTDVTPAQLLTEEATNGNPWGPDARTLKMISKSAFEVDDYWRIVQILHKRLVRFDRKNWRISYKALILLEHLLTHGPESVAEEFQSDKDVIREMESFQHIDEKGWGNGPLFDTKFEILMDRFNWGLNVRKKSEKILKLLNEGTLLKEERERARKLSRGIEGFGSFSHRTSSAQGILHESPLANYGRSNSQFNDHGNNDDQFSPSNDEDLTKTGLEKSEDTHDENANLVSRMKMENPESWNSFLDRQTVENFGFKENMAPIKEDHPTGESKPLLGGQEDDRRHGISIEEDHPFDEGGNLTTVSLLSTTDRILQAC